MARETPVDCDASEVRPMLSMKLVRTQDFERPDAQGVFAKPILDGDQSNVRIIRLAPGQALPPHRHAASDLLLYSAAGKESSSCPKARCVSMRARLPSTAVTRSCGFEIPVPQT